MALSIGLVKLVQSQPGAIGSVRQQTFGAGATGETGLGVGRGVQPRSLVKLLFEWRTDANGNSQAKFVYNLNGYFVKLVTIPNTTGDQPTDQYDISIEDDFQFDLLEGKGANRSNSTNETVDLSPHVTGVGVSQGLWPVVTDMYLFKVENAGSQTRGTAILYYSSA